MNEDPKISFQRLYSRIAFHMQDVADVGTESWRALRQTVIDYKEIYQEIGCNNCDKKNVSLIYGLCVDCKFKDVSQPFEF